MNPKWPQVWEDGNTYRIKREKKNEEKRQITGTLNIHTTVKNNWSKPEKKNKLGDLKCHRGEMIFWWRANSLTSMGEEDFSLELAFLRFQFLCQYPYEDIERKFKLISSISSSYPPPFLKLCSLNQLEQRTFKHLYLFWISSLYPVCILYF